MEVYKRIILALLIGVMSFNISYISLTRRECDGCDFNVSWRAAWHLKEGLDPYQEIQPTGDYPYNTSFIYPLPAAIIATPFTFMHPNEAGAIFFALSASLLAFAVTREGSQHLPLFLSAPFLVAAALAHWAPVIMAAALLPAMQWLAVAKPGIGVAALVYRPTWLGLALTLGFIVLAIIMFPGWPADWLNSLPGEQYKLPFMVFPLGFLLLLSILRWRLPEGRLLLALSIIPQNLWFADQLLLWLVPRSFFLNLALTFVSWLAYGIWRLLIRFSPPGGPAAPPDVIVVTLLCLPVLGILFYQDKLMGDKNDTNKSG